MFNPSEFDQFSIDTVHTIKKYHFLTLFISGLIILHQLYNLKTHAYFISDNKKDYEDATAVLNKFNKEIKNVHVEAKKINVFIPLSYFNTNIDNNLCKNCKAQVKQEDCCLICGCDNRFKLSTAWSDVSRVHSSPKYQYDRSFQFRDYILHYQGKINVPCLDNFLTLIAEMENLPVLKKIDFYHYLGQKFKTDPLIGKLSSRLLNIVVHTLYSIYLKRPNLDLSKIDKLILSDFKTFTAEFTKRKKRRFVSNQYLLYQLLNRHGIETDYDDVLLSETTNLTTSIEVVREIFGFLNWKVY